MTVSKHNYESGFTIVEILVAVTLSLVVLAGVTQIYLGSKTSYKLQEASSGVQESGRIAMEYISHDIRMAGFIGCAQSDVVSVKNNIDVNKSANADAITTVATFDGSNGITGYTFTGVGTFPAALTNYGLVDGDILKATDVIYLQGARGRANSNILCHDNDGTTTVACSGKTLATGTYLISNNTAGKIDKNDIVLLSNCVTVDIHAVTNNTVAEEAAVLSHDDTLNTSAVLHASYNIGSNLYPVRAQVYYIGTGASGQPALFRRSLVHSTMVKEELVEGVYDMDILYGENTGGATNTPSRYVRASDVTDWTKILSARVTLYVRSQNDNVVDVAQPYKVNDAVVKDRRLLREFTSTITLRNRVK